LVGEEGLVLPFVVDEQDESRQIAATSLSWLPVPSGPLPASNTSFGALGKSEEKASTQETTVEAARCTALQYM